MGEKRLDELGERMSGWMDGWTERMDGWMDRVSGWMFERMDECVEGQMDR